jgi:hypothetical protein
VKLKDKVEELERRIRELEARPQFVPVYYPVFQPVQYVPSIVPSWQPWQPQFTFTCGGNDGLPKFTGALVSS